MQILTNVQSLAILFYTLSLFHSAYINSYWATTRNVIYRNVNIISPKAHKARRGEETLGKSFRQLLEAQVCLDNL